MKKTLWMPILAAMTMFSACIDENVIEQTSNEIEAEVELPEAIDGLTSSRGVVYELESGMEMYWGTKESIGVYGTSLTNSKFVSTNKYKETGTAIFAGGSLFRTPKYAYYPYREENASKSMTSVRGDLPQTQDFSTVTKKMNTDYSKSRNTDCKHVLGCFKQTEQSRRNSLEDNNTYEHDANSNRCT